MKSQRRCRAYHALGQNGKKRLFALGSHRKALAHKVPVGRERVEVGLEAEVFTESVDDLDNTHRALEQARA